MHNVYSFFPCQVYRSELPGWVNQTEKITRQYFIESYKEQAGNTVIQTRDMTQNSEFDFIKEHFTIEALYFLDKQGYETDKFKFFVCDLWGQEFKHNGFNFPHSHPNCQVSGLYFYQIAGSKPVNVEVKIYDPRPGKIMTDLPLAMSRDIQPATHTITLNSPVEGTLIMFNSWLTHSLYVQGLDSAVKFLHFNIGYGLKNDATL